MNKTMQKAGVAAAAGLVLAAALMAGCGGSSSGSGAPPPGSTVLPRGTRVLGLDVAYAPASVPAYGDRLTLAHSLGAGYVTSHLSWNLIEPSTPANCNDPGTYNDPGLSALNTMLPAAGFGLMLQLPPITTGADVRPANLQGRSMNDSLVKCRYQRMLTWVLARLPDVTIVSLNLGNEVEYAAGAGSASFWTEYADFYMAAVGHAHTVRPGVPVGITMTLGALTGERGAVVQGGADALNGLSDLIVVNHYPMLTDFTVKNPSQVASDLTALVGAVNVHHAAKPIYFQEFGFQSGSSFVASSDETQRQAMLALFAAWDTHAARIAGIALLRLHDTTQAESDQTATDYGYAPGHPLRNAFSEYIRTLGLRTQANAAKPAWNEVRSQATLRGWP